MTEERAKELANLFLLSPLVAVGILGAFSTKQRKSIIERDKEYGMQNNKGGCQFPNTHDCNGDKQVQVHHILPQRYCAELGIDPDFEANGITLCEHAHQVIVHPDMVIAKRDYVKNGRSYAPIFEARADKLKNKEPYWVTIYDRAFHAVVTRSEQRKNATTTKTE